jgi:threonine synthase
VRALEVGAERIEPVVPATIARSIAIGNPADGALATRTIRRTGGWAAAVTDAALVDGIRLLAETTGIFTETAGGVTVAAALALVRAGRILPTDELVLCITGNGLKTIEAVQPVLAEAPVVLPRLREVARLVETAAHERAAGHAA